MATVSRLLSFYFKNLCNWRRRTIVLLLAVFSLGHAGSVFAVDPPQNIRIENNVLLWDAVDNALNYNVFFLTGPVVDNSQTPRYVTTVENVLEFRPTTDGFYTVVTVAVGDNGLDFSNIETGVIVAFTESGAGTETASVGRFLEIRTASCDNVVAGGSCESQCSLTDARIPTGGACRADAGVVLHQRAQVNSFSCISQNDTSFVEVDVYCLNPSAL